jgi:hypothetical protein
VTIAAKRVVFPTIKHAEWESLSLPDDLRPTEVLVKAAQTLVSAGTEIVQGVAAGERHVVLLGVYNNQRRAQWLV